MGVFATFCKICAMPVEHNSYVPTGGQMYYIYRGPKRHVPGPSSPDPSFPYGPEHDWLLKIVALDVFSGQEPKVLRGDDVQDGDLVIDGDYHDVYEERMALHEVCWEMSGQLTVEALEPIEESDDWQKLERYHHQLFAWDKILEDGEAWMLVDPRLDTPDGRRNRARIQAILKNAKAT